MKIKLAAAAVFAAVLHVGILARPAVATRQPELAVRPGRAVSSIYPPLVGNFYDDHTTINNFSAVCESPGPCDVIPFTLVGVHAPPGGDVVLHIVISYDDHGGTDRLHAYALDPAHEAPGDHNVWNPPTPLDGRIDGRFADPPLDRYDLVVNNSMGANTGFRVDITVEEVGAESHVQPSASSPTGGAKAGSVVSPSTGMLVDAAPGVSTAPSGPAPPLVTSLSEIRPLTTHTSHTGFATHVPHGIVLVALLCLLGAALVQRRAIRERGVSMLSRVAPRAWFSDLRLFWKLLVPFVAVILVIGAVGAYLTVHYLSSRAATTLDQSLLQRSVGASDYLRDEELYLLEAERFAANLQGVPAATASHDQASLVKALASAVAVNKGLDVLAATDAAGAGLVDYIPDGASFAARTGVDWAPAPAVHDVLGGITDASGDKHTSFVRLGDGSVLFLTAGPIRTTGVVGAAVAGISAQKLATGAASRARARVSLYDPSGELMAASGPKAGPRRLPSGLSGSSSVRQRVGGDATLYSPLVIRGARVGTVATTMPVGSAFSAVRGAAYRLGLIVALAMLATIALGMALSRYILRALDPLVETNRALEAGDLSARAPVLGGDELGEVAAGVNRMAASLEESYANLEAKVEARTAEVQRLLQERTDFFTAVSHEFRTPLAVILGQAKMLGDANFEKKVAWHTQSAAVLTDAGTQLLGFVNDILEIAKVDSGRSELEFANVAVGDVLRGLRPTIDALAERNNVALKVHVARRLPPVRADGGRLHQVLLNLVDNAIKYTPPGGKVTVSVRDDGSHVAVEVADTGLGIPPEEAGRLFEPFYRVKGNETQGGQPSSGLGLALVKGLVDAMGGQISFQSQVGGGSTFTVRLPTSATTTNDTEEAGDASSGSLREAAR